MRISFFIRSLIFIYIISTVSCNLSPKGESKSVQTTYSDTSVKKVTSELNDPKRVEKLNSIFKSNKWEIVANESGYLVTYFSGKFYVDLNFPIDNYKLKDINSKYTEPNSFSYTWTIATPGASYDDMKYDGIWIYRTGDFTDDFFIKELQTYLNHIY